ncbi:MAG TPA: S16 family serine protease [Candidatus Acidoferrum sp.]|nr:S16 family serine protease [Candidatus Acidoferrum sp.]
MLLFHAAGAQLVGSASILAPAVTANNTGSLTTIALNVTRGDGRVSIVGPASVANDTNQSAVEAAMYAAQYLNLNFNRYNFVYDIEDFNGNVSGPSAGAAMTMLAISALSGKSLLPDFTMTGTIDNGTIGLVGGVYDKSEAAAERGLNFILVPGTTFSGEDELYYLIQQRFGITVVEVPNISTASGYAFGSVPYSGAGANFSFFTNYYLGLVPDAHLACSNGCSITPFAQLVNFTLNFTEAQASKVPFAGASSGILQAVNESRAIASKGYLYTAADTGFLSYINAFYMSSGNATIKSGLYTLEGVNENCTALSAPQLTKQNYEWVLAGELRQSWGSNSSASAISSYNVSGFTTDDVLNAMYTAAEANGWCTAAGYMFNLARGIGGTPVVQQGNLSALAQSRISRASVFGNNIYLATAESAYAHGNYALAIIDADYSYADGVAAQSSTGLSAGQLLNMSQAIASNSTYGVWATEFADQSEFYIQQAAITDSVVGERANATDAYSNALLAAQISNDTQIIYNNLAPGQPTTTIVGVPATTSIAASPIAAQTPDYIAIYSIFVLLAIILILDLIILVKLSRLEAKLKRGSARRRRR